MIAKLIVTGFDRENCIARARRALTELCICGVATPVSVLEQILAHPDFAQDFTIGTKWFEEKFLPELELPATTESGNSQDADIIDVCQEMQTLLIEIDGKRHELRMPAMAFAGAANSATPTRRTQPRRGRSGRKSTSQASANNGAIGADGVLASPMQAIVVRTMVEPGQEVAEGDILVVLEAMKMEKYLHASRAGVVEEILTTVGTNVTPGTPLLKLSAETENAEVA